MKIGLNEIHEALYEVAIQKLKKSLEREGFKVELNHLISWTSQKKTEVDLYAIKGEERRIYEIKIGKYKISRTQFNVLQMIAKELGAKLFVTYLEVPHSKVIEYDQMNELLLNYLLNNVPSELDFLSTHTEIDEVENIDLTLIKIINNKTVVEGNATLQVTLNYGSNSDRRDGLGDETSDSFDFYFRVSVVDGEITETYFKFDLEHFYE